MPMTRSCNLLVLTTLLALTPQVALACMCPPPPPAKEAAKSSDRVFLGKVTSIRDHTTSDFTIWIKDRIADLGAALGKDWRISPEDYFYREVTLRVVENFKGAPVNELLITTGSGGGDCGFPFDVGQSYLVFARQLKEPNELVTSICDATGNARRLQPEIAQIRSGI